MSLMGLSSSMSMGTLVLWIQVLVHRCLSRTYEFLEDKTVLCYLYHLASLLQFTHTVISGSLLIINVLTNLLLKVCLLKRNTVFTH